MLSMVEWLLYEAGQRAYKNVTIVLHTATIDLLWSR